MMIYLTGNVPMKQRCTYSHQCSDFPDAACLGGRCECIDGYTVRNVRDCVKRKNVLILYVLSDRSLSLRILPCE